MTRNERRKAARARKNAKAEKLNAWAIDTLVRETVKRNLRGKRGETSYAGNPITGYAKLGNRSIYTGMGMFPRKG